MKRFTPGDFETSVPCGIPNCYVDGPHSHGAGTTIPSELETLRAEVEQLRVQLAGCGVAAMCNTRESMEKQRCRKGDYGWSPSYEDVIRHIETEIRYREALERIGHICRCIQPCDCIERAEQVAKEALKEGR